MSKFAHLFFNYRRVQKGYNMHLRFKKRTENTFNVYYRYKDILENKNKDLYLFSFDKTKKYDLNLELHRAYINKIHKTNSYMSVSQDKRKAQKEEYNKLFELLIEQEDKHKLGVFDNIRPTIEYIDSTNMIIHFKDRDINIKEYAIEFLKDNYDLDLDIPVVISKDFIAESTNVRQGSLEIGYIEVYNKYIAYAKCITLYYFLIIYKCKDSKQFLSTLKHELIHYAIFKKYGKGYLDGEEVFEKELKKHNVYSSKVHLTKEEIEKHYSRLV